MDLAQALRIALQITIFSIVFATGLVTTTADLGYVVRRPGLLGRSLLATVILAPLVALLLWRTLPIGAPTAIAIIASALAPGLPTVPRKGREAGANVAFATSLMFTTALLSVVTIPLWLAILERFFGIAAAVTIAAVARILLLGILLPLMAGVAFRRLAPKTADRIAGPVGALANALMPGLVLVVLLVGASALLELGWAALLAMVLAPLVALAVGHALGGPEPRDRTVLAIANAGRFPALAALIASTSFPEVRAIPAVIAYVVIANLLALPYVLARKRAHRAEPEVRAAEGERPAVPAPSA